MLRQCPSFAFLIITLVWVDGSSGEPKAAPQAAKPTSDAPAAGGSLVICGGGLLPRGVVARFVELAGGKTMNHSIRIGVGAGAGRFLGTVFKFAIGMAIWLIATMAAFWP